MLIVKVFVNDTQIDEIHVQNVSEIYTVGTQEYAIRKPKRKKKYPIIKHEYSDGWKPLLKKVLEIL